MMAAAVGVAANMVGSLEVEERPVTEEARCSIHRNPCIEQTWCICVPNHKYFRGTNSRKEEEGMLEAKAVVGSEMEEVPAEVAVGLEMGGAAAEAPRVAHRVG